MEVLGLPRLQATQLPLAVLPTKQVIDKWYAETNLPDLWAARHKSVMEKIGLEGDKAREKMPPRYNHPKHQLCARPRSSLPSAATAERQTQLCFKSEEESTSPRLSGSTDNERKREAEKSSENATQVLKRAKTTDNGTALTSEVTEDATQLLPGTTLPSRSTTKVDSTKTALKSSPERNIMASDAKPRLVPEDPLSSVSNADRLNEDGDGDVSYLIISLSQRSYHAEQVVNMMPTGDQMEAEVKEEELLRTSVDPNRFKITDQSPDLTIICSSVSYKIQSDVVQHCGGDLIRSEPRNEIDRVGGGIRDQFADMFAAATQDTIIQLERHRSQTRRQRRRQGRPQSRAV